MWSTKDPKAAHGQAPGSDTDDPRRHAGKQQVETPESVAQVTITDLPIFGFVLLLTVPR
jgi:hypothetical protein